MKKEHGVGCGCCNASASEQKLDTVDAAVESALLQGLFPDRIQRRNLLKAVGASTILGALAAILPVGTLKSMAQEGGAPEKTDIDVGFLPITCATPLIFGAELGEYAKQGLNVRLQKIPAIGTIRDKMINGELDVSQQVMPVPLTMTAGTDGTRYPAKILSILNQNGNSLVLAKKHVENRDPKNWKGFVFAVPFEQSHQALQLRSYLASHGLDPQTDVQYRVVPPTEYVSMLRVGTIDGFFGGEPGGQRAVYEDAGFIHLISKELWDGHPCCSVTALDSWVSEHPNTFMAFYRAIIASSLHVSDPANRGGIASVLARPDYLNAPEIVVNQVITGRFADGLGNVREEPHRIDFNPFPQYAAAVWMLVQLKRWNLISGDLDYKALAQEVMLATDAAKIMAETTTHAPEVDFDIIEVGGEQFDSNSPEQYL